MRSRAAAAQRLAHDLHPEQDQRRRTRRARAIATGVKTAISRRARTSSPSVPTSQTARTTTIIGSTSRDLSHGTRVPFDADERAELLVGRRLRRRVPRLPLRLQRRGLRGARHRGRRPARADRARTTSTRTRRPTSSSSPPTAGSPRRAARSAAISSATGSASALLEGESLVYWLRKLVFRGAWLDHRVKEGLLEVAWDEETRRLRLRATRAAAGRCSSSRPCRRGTSSSSAVDARARAASRFIGVAARRRHAGRRPRAARCSALAALARRSRSRSAVVPPLLRAQALVVVVVATCAEVVGSIIWGVYTYRLENLPSFVPPVPRPRLPRRRVARGLGGAAAGRCSSASRSSPSSPGGSRA